jgi:parvulin-like peptidyl-prolyl isomerase
MGPMSEPAAKDRRRARWLLGLGAAVGLALAASNLLSAPAGPGLPPGTVARVNHVIIRSDEYERLLAALASDRRTPLDAEDRQHVLDRLIEEELLVQYALELGLTRTDRRVRADLVSAVLASVNAAADGSEPSDAELERFYAENRDYFAWPPRVHVRDVFLASGSANGDAAERAALAAARLRAGQPIEQVRRELGDTALAPAPDAPLPAAKLREYLGPTALSAALALEPGAVSDPVETPQGYLVLQLVARSESAAPPLAEVEPQVRTEMRRRAGDRLLRERLDELRADADVRVAPSPDP